MSDVEYFQAAQQRADFRRLSDELLEHLISSGIQSFNVSMLSYKLIRNEFHSNVFMTAYD